MSNMDKDTLQSLAITLVAIGLLYGIISIFH